MQNLPIELKQKIILYSEFDKIISLFSEIAHYAYNPEIHTWNFAAINGHIDLVRWLHFNHKEGCTTNDMDLAAKNGHLEIVKFLHFNRKEGCTKRAMDYAAHNGHLQIVKWLHFNSKEGCTIKAMDWASRNGHIGVVKWLRKKCLL